MERPSGPGDFFEGKIFNLGFIFFNINRITDILYFTLSFIKVSSQSICAFKLNCQFHWQKSLINILTN